jgi:hypothetical protein
MQIHNSMNLSQLGERMGSEATQEDAERMRALLVEHFDGQDTADIAEADWLALLDRAAKGNEKVVVTTDTKDIQSMSPEAAQAVLSNAERLQLKSSMAKLEITLIDLARQHLASVLDYYKAQQAGTDSEADENDYMADHGALLALLQLGHVADSGMSTEAIQALREIEGEHSAYLNSVGVINALVLSDVGPSSCTFLPEVDRWAAELAALAKADMQGQIEALVWPYRLGGDEYLAVDMRGTGGGDLSITFVVGGVKTTEYDFDNLAGNSCFSVPDMTEALSMTVALVEKLSATVMLLNRQR